MATSAAVANPATPAAPASPDRIAGFANQLKEISSKAQEIAEAIGSFPGLAKAGGLLSDFAGILGKAGDTAANVAMAITDNKEGGAVSQTLGVAEAILGGLGGSSDEGEGGDQEDSTLDKVKEKVSQLKAIWDEYYTDLFDKEGKLSLAKAANLAMEVGGVLLGTKKMEKVRKAFAIGDVIRKGAMAVMTAAASAPFPANLIPIAKAVATTASQLGVVKGQAHDGLDNVPSTGTYLLEKGERVVDKRLNRDLSTYLKGSQTTVNSRESTVTNSPSINLTINGNAPADSVEKNRGALESMIRDIFADHALAAPFD